MAAVEAIEPKKGLLSKVRLSSRVSVTSEEFETLCEQAKAFAVTKETLEKRSKSLIAREQVVSRRDALLDSHEYLSERNRSLTAENSLLRDQLSSEKDKNIKLEAKIREFAVYANDRQQLKDTRAELEDTRSQLAKEKEEHAPDDQRLCDLSIQDLSCCFVKYFVKHYRENEKPTQQKQVDRRQRGPER